MSIACENTASENDNNTSNNLQSGDHKSDQEMEEYGFLNYDYAYWQEGVGKHAGISQPIFSEEKLRELAKKDEYKDYNLVVKEFVKNQYNKEIKSIQTANFNTINAHYKNMLVHTSDDLIFIIKLKKWMNHNGIWTVDSYPQSLNKNDLSHVDRFEIIDGIPSYRDYGLQEYKNKVEHNFNLLSVEEAEDIIQDWAEELLSFDAWRVELFHDLSKQNHDDHRDDRYEGDTYVLITAPADSTNSIMIDFVKANNDEIEIHYKQIINNDYEQFGTVQYVLLHFENLLTHNAFAIRTDPIIEYPSCDNISSSDKPCPSSPNSKMN